MLTPLDIHNKVFDRAFRGYRMEDVDAFLDEIIRAFETLFRENKEQQEAIARLEAEAAKSREFGVSLEKTMVLAQKVFDEETARAQKEAGLILWEAEKKGEKIVEDARKEALEVRQRIEHLRLYEKQLYLKHKGFLEFQMELLNGYNEKETVLSDGDMDRMLLGVRDRDGLAGEAGEKHVLPEVVSGEKGESVESPLAEAGPGSETAAEAGRPALAGAGTAAAAAASGAVSLGLTGAEDDFAAGPAAGGPAADSPSAGSPAGEAPRADNPAASSPGGAQADTGGADPFTEQTEAAVTAAAGGSPFIVDRDAKSMEQVVLLAQKMEDALKALDTMYGTDEPASDRP